MKRFVLICAFILTAIFVLSCLKKEPGKNGTLTVIYSGNIGARYDPCGCRIPMGGLARRSTAIEEIKETAQDVLVLDTGALIFEKHKLYPPYEPVKRMTAHLMIDVLNGLGMDAVNVSSMELANGPDSLLAYDKMSSWPWLSANIVWKDTGELLCSPDVIKTVGNLRVGIFGFMDQALMGVPFFDERSPVTVLDPVETVKKEVEKLGKEGVDLVVALAYMDKKNVENLVAAVPGINLIIHGHTNEHNPSSDHNHFHPYKVNDTIIARCPDGGRVIGVMKVEMWNGSTDFENRVINIDLRPDSVKEKIDPKDRKSNFSNKFIDLDPSIMRDRVAQDRLNEVGGRIDELHGRLKAESE